MADVVALVADHAGFELKNTSKGGLDEQAVETIDLGSQTADSIDYPDPAAKLAAARKEGPTQHGLMVCGSGIGVAIASEPLSVDPGEDALCHLAGLAGEHNDAIALALGSWLVGLQVARDHLLTFFEMPFVGRRHASRVDRMSAVVPQP
jgi:ribose 5-phosphate isomerase B